MHWYWLKGRVSQRVTTRFRSQRNVEVRSPAAEVSVERPKEWWGNVRILRRQSHPL